MGDGDYLNRWAGSKREKVRREELYGLAVFAKAKGAFFLLLGPGLGSVRRKMRPDPSLQEGERALAA